MRALSRAAIAAFLLAGGMASVPAEALGANAAERRRAQEFTGSIYGRIVDPTNSPLPGVSITVEGDAIQGQRTVLSEANGSYR